MALSPEYGAGIYPDSKSEGIFEPKKVSSEADFTNAIIPSAATPENFWKLDGAIQETVLISLLEKDNKEKIKELRPDFEIDRKLTWNETRMSEWTQQIANRNEPIMAPQKDIDDGLFAQIHHTTHSVSKQELALKLEAERKRKQEFKPNLFSASENIGGYSAAIRYRGALENHVKSLKKIT